MTKKIAEKIMSYKNSLTIKLNCEGHSIKTLVLLGSKQVVYHFKDGSVIRWQATPNTFEIQE